MILWFYFFFLSQLQGIKDAVSVVILHAYELSKLAKILKYTVY